MSIPGFEDLPGQDTLPGPPPEAADWALAQALALLGYGDGQDAAQAALCAADMRAYVKALPEGEHLQPYLITLLQQCCSLDGEWPLAALPEVGECSLRSRVAHYRLWALGLWPQADIAQPFQAGTLERLRPWHDWLGTGAFDALLWLNLAGNVFELWALLEQRLAREAMPLWVRLEDTGLGPAQEAALRASGGSTADAAAQAQDLYDALEALKQHPALRALSDKAWQAAGLEGQQYRHALSEDIEALIRGLNAQHRLDDAAQRGLWAQLAEREKAAAAAFAKAKAQVQEAQAAAEAAEAALKTLKRRIAGVDVAALQAKIQGWQQDLKRAEVRGDQAKAQARRADIEAALAQLQARQLWVQESAAAEALLAAKAAALDLATEQREALEKDWRPIVERTQQEISRVQDKLKELAERVQPDMLDLQKQLRALQARSEALHFDFWQQLRRDMPQQAETLGQMAAFPEAPAQAGRCVRLLQLYLWTAGYYQGHLDALFGSRTLGALSELATERRSLHLPYVLHPSPADAQTWLINFNYLSRHIMADLSEQQAGQDTEAPSLRRLFERFRRATAERAADMVPHIQAAWAELRADVAAPQGAARRLYLGGRRLLRRLGQAFGRILRWLWGGVKRLFDLARHFVKLLLQEMSLGYQHFAEGMQFLFGSRVLAHHDAAQEPLAYSDFDGDFDNITVLRGSAAAEVQAVAGRIAQRSARLVFALRLCGAVVKWALRAAKLGLGLTWPQLLLRLAWECRYLVKNRGPHLQGFVAGPG